MSFSYSITVSLMTRVSIESVHCTSLSKFSRLWSEPTVRIRTVVQCWNAFRGNFCMHFCFVMEPLAISFVSYVRCPTKGPRKPSKVHLSRKCSVRLPLLSDSPWSSFVDRMNRPLFRLMMLYLYSLKSMIRSNTWYGHSNL